MNREEKLKWYKEEFEDISNGIKNSNGLSHHDFLRIRNFKLQNSSTEKEKHILEVTTKAFKLAQEDKIKEAINVLLDLEGVRVPIASTFLAMKFPDKYAIIDRKVLVGLNKKEWLKKYLTSPEIYEEYILLMRKLAKEKGIKLRDFERGLFEGRGNE